MPPKMLDFSGTHPNWRYFSLITNTLQTKSNTYWVLSLSMLPHYAPKYQSHKNEGNTEGFTDLGDQKHLATECKVHSRLNLGVKMGKPALRVYSLATALDQGWACLSTEPRLNDTK